MIAEQEKQTENNDIKQQKVQKRVFGVVLFIGVAALIFGIVSFYQNIEKPFKISEDDTEPVSETEQVSVLEDLKTKDTDADGLPDYDELYIYETSPYLADSDSDSINDKLEIEQSTNPNCPEGKDCTGFGDSELNTNTSTSTDVIDPENLSVDVLRNALIDAGAPLETISNISDDELMQMYRDSLDEQGLNGTATDANVNASELQIIDNIDAQELRNLDAEGIRQFLLESGADQELLDQVDDESLKVIFQEALKEQGL